MISVVIPTHNRKDLLIRAIKSVQNQIFRDLEIIVVSDGSTDGTDKIVEKIKEYDSRIYFVNLPVTRGANVARNAGIQFAHGEWVAFLDDDDEWLSEKIEKQMQLVNTNSAIGLCYTGVRCIYVNYGIDYLSVPNYQGNLRKNILLGNCIGTTSTVMVKKDLFKKSGLFDETLCALQDYDLWIRICQLTDIGVVTAPLINYYNYNSSGQISSNTEKYENAIEVINEKYSTLFDTLSENERKKKKLFELNLLSNKCLRNGDKKAAKKYAKKALSTKLSINTIERYMMCLCDFKVALKLRKFKRGG